MNLFNANDLPPVNAVEIIRLSEMAEKTLAPSVRVDGELAQNIADLFRRLPFAGQMRCHIPPFELRFFNGQKQVLHCSICWECNNIWILEGKTRRTIEFDAKADVSQQLLQLLKELVPNHAIEEADETD